jgi:hypothetical protein
MHQSRMSILGVHAAILASSPLYVGSASTVALVVAGVTSLSFASTTLILNASNTVEFKPFMHLFSHRGDGMRAMGSAHDILFQLTGRRQGEALTSALRRLDGAVETRIPGHTRMSANSPATNARIKATGVTLDQKMSGSVDVMADQIVRETLFCMLIEASLDGESLPVAAQRYILARSPELVHECPTLFDAPTVEMAYPNLLRVIATLQSMGFSEPERLTELRLWLNDGGATALGVGESLPELAPSTSMYASL